MAHQSAQQVKKVLWQILFANLAVAIAKIIIGTMIQSASMMSDGYHSLTDGVSNVVGLVGISVAAKPVDASHPYGHGKYEFLTSLFIGVMLLLIAAKIGYEAFQRISAPIEPEFGAEALIMLVVTLIINIIVSEYENRQGKRLNSYILISDSLHTRSDIFVSLGVLLTLIGIKFGAPPIIDPLASIIVGIFIVRAGIEIIKSTSEVLVDKATADHEEIKAITLRFGHVIDVHDIRSRGTETNMFVDMHITVDPAMSIEESHKLVHDIEDQLRLEINPKMEVIIHTEPAAERA